MEDYVYRSPSVGAWVLITACWYEYLDAKGRQQRGFDITPSGFSKLALGFRGPKAEAFRDAYVAEFQRMEHALTASPTPVTPVTAVPALPDFTNPAIAARAWADQFDRAEEAEKANGRLLAFPESLGVTEAAKILKLPPRQLSALLLDWKWTYIKRGRKRNKTLAYQSIIDRGLMVHDAFEADDGRVHYHPKITAEGMGMIARTLPAFS